MEFTGAKYNEYKGITELANKLRDYVKKYNDYKYGYEFY